MTDQTLGQIYQDMRAQLRVAGFDTPDLDARLLVACALGCAPADVVLKPDMPVNTDAVQRLMALLARRLAHEPVAKITGTKEFYGLTFHVTTDVLDPRPDSECLVEAAIRYAQAQHIPAPRVLDICTGTGCLLISILHQLPHATGLGVDISAAALAVSQQNCMAHGLAQRMTLVQSDWLAALPPDLRFDLIVCNPPYIPTHEIDTLAQDVRNYDPMLALDGGISGLAAYEKIFPQILSRLTPGGVALFEHGAGQADDVAACAALHGLQVISTVQDLAGHTRVVCLR